MTFAEKLKSIRKQAGMSQEQLAEKPGVSRQADSKFEKNTRPTGPVKNHGQCPRLLKTSPTPRQ